MFCCLGIFHDDQEKREGCHVPKPQEIKPQITEAEPEPCSHVTSGKPFPLTSLGTPPSEAGEQDPAIEPSSAGLKMFKWAPVTCHGFPTPGTSDPAPQPTLCLVSPPLLPDFLTAPFPAREALVPRAESNQAAATWPH